MMGLTMEQGRFMAVTTCGCPDEVGLPCPAIATVAGHCAAHFDADLVEEDLNQYLQAPE